MPWVCSQIILVSLWSALSHAKMVHLCSNRFPVYLPLTTGVLLRTGTPGDGHLGTFCPFGSSDVGRPGVLGRPN